MKKSIQFLIGLIVILHGAGVVAHAQSATCRYDMKDYDSPGYGIPKRKGLSIEARFGCVYSCTCPNGSRWKVSHVLEEKHFDLAVFSSSTGGPSRARWFICPQSIKPDSWTPYRDELGRIIAYSVESSHEEFPVEKMKSSPQIQSWLQTSCQGR